MIRTASTSSDPRAIAALAMECASQPKLLPVFLRILAMVPHTVAELSIGQSTGSSTPRLKSRASRAVLL